MPISVVSLMGGASKVKETINCHMYVMLTIPPSYKHDLRFLVDEFKYRYSDIADDFDYNKPDVRHMTLLKVDLLLTPFVIDKIIQGSKLARSNQKAGDFYRKLVKDSRGGDSQNGDLWHIFSDFLALKLEGVISRDLAGIFKGLPADTTASCYQSRFDLFGDFAVIQYKPDLGFHKVIFPCVKDSVSKFFGSVVKAGDYYDHPRKVLLHISFGRHKHSKKNHSRIKQNKGLLKLQSDHRENWLGPQVAKNFVINRDHFQDHHAVMVSLGRPRFY